MGWFVVAVVVVVTGTVVTHRWLRKQTQPRRSTAVGPDRRNKDVAELVLDAFDTEWAKRFDSTEQTVRSAILAGRDPALVERVDAEIGVVDLKFDGTGADRASVATTIIVNYAKGQASSTAQLTLPWDRVPDGVRAELLRTPRSTVFRKWRVAPDRQDTP